MRKVAGIASAAIWLISNTLGAEADSSRRARTERLDAIECPSAAIKGNQLRGPAASGAQEYYQSAGADLIFKRFGNGPIVVLLAGGPGLDAVYLEPVARGIAASGYQVILPDLRGTGGSKKAGKDVSMLTVKGSVADVEALRCALGQDRLRLVGHSFGGAVELAYAAEHPRHVSHLVGLDPVGPDMEAESKYDDAVRHNLTTEEVAQMEATAPDQRLRFELLASVVDRQKAEILLRSLPADFVHPEVDRAVDEDYDRNFHVADQVKNLDAKVTIIEGVFDPIRVWEPSLRAVFPQAPLVLIPGAAHLPWIDKPEETFAALGKALAR